MLNCANTQSFFITFAKIVFCVLIFYFLFFRPLLLHNEIFFPHLNLIPIFGAWVESLVSVLRKDTENVRTVSLQLVVP